MRNPRIDIITSESYCHMEAFQDGVNEQLELGFKVQNSFSSGKEIIIILMHPGTPEKIKGPTAYPSDKQLGYIGWAYQLDAEDLETASLSKREASALISHHMDTCPGMQISPTSFHSDLERVRPSDSEDKPPLAPATESTGSDEFDEDLPF